MTSGRVYVSLLKIWSRSRKVRCGYRRSLQISFTRLVSRAWGYRVFTVVFSWWCRRAYVQEVVDFIEYPPGKGPSQVKSVLPHTGRREPESKPEPLVYWCVFSA